VHPQQICFFANSAMCSSSHMPARRLERKTRDNPILFDDSYLPSMLEPRVDHADVHFESTFLVCGFAQGLAINLPKHLSLAAAD
jgi:hypothetical protein